jgi:hypothetical protein
VGVNKCAESDLRMVLIGAAEQQQGQGQALRDDSQKGNGNSG